MTYIKSKYNAEFTRENYDRIVLNLRKDSMLKSRLEELVIITSKSKNQLIIEAIEMLLAKYGIDD